MEKTHKLLIKWKIFLSLNNEQANSMFKRLMQSEIKIKIHDKENNIFLNPYTTDVILQKLDDFEIKIENTNLSVKQKRDIYNIIDQREVEKKRLNDSIIQNIIDTIMKLDN